MFPEFILINVYNVECDIEKYLDVKKAQYRKLLLEC